MQNLPLVSVVMPAHDRHHLLPIALACYRHQTYRNRELIVVDDSREPIDGRGVEDVGGRLIRMEPGTPLGAKLNRGLLDARGTLCQKKDDDDWYAPDFLQRMVSAMMAEQARVCRPGIACLMPIIFFDVARWEVRVNEEAGFTGASFLFSRADWKDSPFRPITQLEDFWFLSDLTEMGGTVFSVHAMETFLQVRHRGHLWTHHGDGTPLDTHINSRPRFDGGPEALLPDWALAFYRNFQKNLLQEAASEGPR